MGFIYAIIVPINTLYNTISSIAIAIFGSGMIRRNELPQDGINVFSTYMGNVNTQLQQIVVQYQAIKGAQGGLKHSGDILGLPVESVDANTATGSSTTKAAISSATIDGDLVFNNVTYAYPDGRLALKDVSLVIPHGKRTVIIGGNGAGKSTLLKLLLRLYEPTSGSVELHTTTTIHANEIALDRYRAAFGYAPQHPYIFAGTVGQNLTYGLSDADADDSELLQQAIDLAHVSSFPDGLDTVINEGGSNVSGGEAQRIALGRAIISHPKYLLLDEATSAVDQGTASQILSGIDSRKDQWTIVQVTHNPIQAQSADYVVVLSDGNVEATGTPEEVSKVSTYYRQFIASES